MFPYQQSDAFSSSYIFSDPHQVDIGHEDIVLNQSSFEGGNLASLTEESQRHKLLSNPNNNDGDHISNDDRKIMRKVVERQRRKQVSSLHSTLRSLLPLEFIKGKRSMSDVMTEAANYIKHLKRNNEKLSIKRDKLGRLSNSSPHEQGNNSSNNSLMTNHVTVSPYLGGVELIISRVPGSDGVFLLSKVLKALLEEGLDVVNCVTTQGNGRSYITIQCQASSPITSDVQSALRQKLDGILSSLETISE